MAVNKRQTNSCSPGYSFYTCATTGFKGCCSADACAMIDGCPAEQRDPNDLASMAGDDATEKTSSDSSSTVTDTSTSSPSVKTPPMMSARTSTPTVQSSSPTQAPLTTSGTPTGSGATAAAKTATNANGNSSSKPSPSKTPIIIGAVLGVVVAAVVIWLVWFGVRRKRKRIRDEATKSEREHWLQGQSLPGSDQSPGFYSDGYYSAASVPSKRGGSAPSSQSSPNNGGVFPSPVVASELSAEPSPKPELSPNPETLEINKARDQSRLSSQSTSTTDRHPSPRHPASGIEMRSNLEVSDEEDVRRGSHVMSWMSYANGAAGPGGGAG